MKCDRCQEREEEWMYPEGEATFFACTPCREEIDTENADADKTDHDPDRWVARRPAIRKIQ